jgi:hypothetical protein
MNLRLAGISTIPSSRANAEINGVTSNSAGVPVGRSEGTGCRTCRDSTIGAPELPLGA